jgi:hypothetical protein
MIAGRNDFSFPAPRTTSLGVAALDLSAVRLEVIKRTNMIAGALTFIRATPSDAQTKS